MENIKAYGAGLAGGQFDKNTFFKKPTVVFKCASFVFGIILWYCISKGGWHRLSGSTHHQVCLYGSSTSTCSFASALGFFAVVGAALLLFSDARFDNISSVPTRKRVILADLVVSGCFAVIYLIGFFTFWSKLGSLEIDEPVKTGYVKFGVLMSLFSLGAWGGAAFFAWRRHEEGAADAFHENFDDHFAGVSSDVQEGYGYGGNSDGIGAIGVGNTSYQAGGPAIPNIPQQPPQQQQQQQPPTNPYVNSQGYGY